VHLHLYTNIPLYARWHTRYQPFESRSEGMIEDDAKTASTTAYDRNGAAVLHLNGAASASIDAYFEYRSIVGDADGGILFTPEQYDEYRRQRQAAPRTYVSWRPIGEPSQECRAIGPESMCECTTPADVRDCADSHVPHRFLHASV
jgi:hypothetical protein